MIVSVGDKVRYRTPMDQDVVATVVSVTPNEDDADSPFLDLTFTDPTFKQEFTVHEIEREGGIFIGSPHVWRPLK